MYFFVFGSWFNVNFDKLVELYRKSAGQDENLSLDEFEVNLSIVEFN